MNEGVTIGGDCVCCGAQECECPRCSSGACLEDRDHSIDWDGNAVTMSQDTAGSSLLVAVLNTRATASSCITDDVETPVCSWQGQYVVDASHYYNINTYWFERSGTSRVRVCAEYVESGSVTAAYDSGDIDSGSATFDCDTLSEGGTATRCVDIVSTGPASVAFTVSLA